MAGITEQGLVIKTAPEILEDIQTKMRERVDPSWDTKENNLINIYSNIIADKLAQVYSGIQGVWDGSFPATAFDVGLDNCGDKVGVKRRGKTKSISNVEFTGVVGTTVSQGTLVETTGSGSRFETVAPLVLNSNLFSKITVSVSTVTAGVAYSITINSETYSYIASATPSEAEICSGLATQINTNSLDCVASNPTLTTLLINVVEDDSVLPIVVGSRLSITSISNVVGVEAKEDGSVVAPEGTLTVLPVPVSGITSVINLKSATVGKPRETDDEFRVRRYESVSVIGSGTFASIRSKVRNVPDVTTAFVIANESASTDVDGRPAKSFEVVVEGGDLDEIAETIWVNHPVGIESTGDITRTYVDEDNVPRVVKFSRPVPVYIHVNVTYTRYLEEVTPATASTAIKNAIVSYGNSLSIGSDVIPKRFYGSIYSNVNGIEDINISISKSYDGITPITTFSQNTLSISKKESPTFVTTLINVTEV